MCEFKPKNYQFKSAIGLSLVKDTQQILKINQSKFMLSGTAHKSVF